MSYKNTPESINRRHLSGFRMIQREVLASLKSGGVTPKDYRSVAAAYREAVDGERSVLGIAKGGADEAEETCLRWVLDETAGPGGTEVDEEQV